MRAIAGALLCLLAACAAAGAGEMFASEYDCCARTASGERFNPNGLTAAHKTLPFGTRLRVTYQGRSIEVRINDRGPFIKGRDLDLARGAARALRFPGLGTVQTEEVSNE